MFNVFDVRLISYLTVYMWNAIYNIHAFKSSGKDGMTRKLLSTSLIKNDNLLNSNLKFIEF